MVTTSNAANQTRVVLHSTALNDLMQRAWLRRTPRWVDSLAILGLVLLGAVATLFRGTVSLLLVWVIGIAACFALSAISILKSVLVPGLMSAGVSWTGVKL